MRVQFLLFKTEHARLQATINTPLVENFSSKSSMRPKKTTLVTARELTNVRYGTLIRFVIMGVADRAPNNHSA